MKPFGSKGFLAQRRRLTSIISSEWMLKCISLLLGIGLWYFVGGEDRIDKNIMVPIEIINLPRDLVISNQFKKEIEVTVSGPRSLILEMRQRAVTRQIDLSDATPGTMVIENDNDHIPVSRGITVQRVKPSSIILSLDKLVQRQFPVVARTVGKVADGYYLKALQTDPEVISITGPLTVLSQFSELSTKAIDINGVKQSSHLQVPLELTPDIVALIGETSVTADLSIALETVTKTVKEMAVEVVVDGKRRKVTPPTVQVAMKIPKKMVGKKLRIKKLFTVTAVERENSELWDVEIIPQKDLEYPIEVLSVLPSQVLVESPNPAPVYKTDAEPVDKNGGALVPVRIAPDSLPNKARVDKYNPPPRTTAPGKQSEHISK